MKNQIKVKLTGPQGSGKTVAVRALQKLLHQVGVPTSVDETLHTLEFPSLTEQQIKKLLK